MANLTYSTRPTENLVVDPAPKHKRIEFSHLEIQQDVEAGAVLAKELMDKNLLDNLYQKL